LENDREAAPADREVHTMPHHWPEDTDFALLELDVIDRGNERVKLTHLGAK
jgi:hypothetical protein